MESRLINREEIKRIYALASGAGLLESGSRSDHSDNLHALVFSLTNKESIKTLTDTEFAHVQQELITRMRGTRSLPPEKKKSRTKPGMMTKEQQSMAWRMIYRLRELDQSTATAGDRMVGAIKKTLGTDATVKNPFIWVSFDQGAKLIEQLKRYVRSAETKAGKQAGADSG